MTRSELLEVVYRFYPRGVPAYEPAYDGSEERRRLTDAARRGAAEYPTWDAMLGRLYDRYSLQNESLHILAGGRRPGVLGAHLPPWRDRGDHAHLPRVPPRALLRDPPHGRAHRGAGGERLAREIEATYPGYQPIPSEIGNYVVPDAAMESRMFGEVTIYVFLLSKVWEWAGVHEP